jgi:hypothetical protein
MQRHMSILQNRFKPKCSSTSLCITFETLELHKLQCSFKVNYIKTTSTHCSVMGNYIKTTLDQCSFIGNYIKTTPNQCSSMGNYIKTTSHNIIFSGNVIIDYDIYHEISYLVDLHRYFQSHVNSKNHITYHVS